MIDHIGNGRLVVFTDMANYSDFIVIVSSIFYVSRTLLETSLWTLIGYPLTQMLQFIVYLFQK